MRHKQSYSINYHNNKAIVEEDIIVYYLLLLLFHIKQKEDFSIYIIFTKTDYLHLNWIKSLNRFQTIDIYRVRISKTISIRKNFWA